MSRAFSALLIVAFLWATPGGASASSLNPAPAVRAGLSTGTTLAVVRAGGASLYDDGGKPLLDLSIGATVKVSGRTSDNQWFYGSIKDGTRGWVSSASVVIFGVKNVAERAGFSAPAATESAPAATPGSATAGTADAGKSTAAAVRMPAVVESGAEPLNVRSGPGTTYPAVASVATGAALTAAARNAAADWIRVEGTALPGGSGWVSALYLTLEGNALDLPIADAAASAAARPSPAPAAGLSGKLVFQESSGGKIYVYDLASGALRTLTTGADPDLSPDGRSVVFWRGAGADNGLYLIDIDGANERRILRRAEQVRAPAWSPDGSKIVFSHVDGDKRCRDAGHGVCLPDAYPYDLLFPLVVSDRWGLARVDRDGGNYQDLIAAGNAIAPDWSPLGIFYGGSGVQVTQDVSDDSQNRAVLSENRYQDPAVQPGGDRIVFHSLEKDHWEILSARVDGSGVTALTRPATTLVSILPHNVAPAWSPDGRHIVFLSNRTGTWQLWVMDADGGNPGALPLDVAIAYNYQAEQVVSWGK